MCGLFGIIDFNHGAISLDQSIHHLNSLEHRGPDGQGYYFDGDVFLGHRRLSIIDVEGGKQPIYNEDGSILVICNGEIYNHQELRRQLQSKGHKFKTRSDTEVLVHLYEEEGKKLVEKLNGMFALAIYDIKRRQLFLARDRVGIKPLYYWSDKDKFIFSSEMKAIIISGLVPLVIDDRVVYQYLTLHYSIPPHTLIKNIKSIKPGHCVLVSGDGIEHSEYWDIQSNIDAPQLSYNQAFQETERLLLDSVEKRLMSDVPLGLFLSGGIDSSLIAVLMHRIVGKGINTFSIGFKEKGYSELPYARQVSNQISSHHREIIVTAEELMKNIESVIWYRETPISEFSDIPVFLLSKAAAEKVKVVLTGEGGDEVFAGYNKYIFEQWAVRSGLLRVSFIQSMIHNDTMRSIIQRRFSTALELFSEVDRFRRYYRWFSYFRNEELRDIVRSERNDFIEDSNIYEELTSQKEFRSYLDEMQYLDIKVWLPDNLLLRGDRMSMASSLEARVPFLDHRLVELSYQLPKKLKIKGSKGKYLIKKIAEKYLDKSIIYRNKIGFEVPVSHWFRGEMKEYLRDHLTRNSAFCRDYFKRDSIEKLIDDHQTGKNNNYKKLWILLNLELWRDRFISQ